MSAPRPSRIGCALDFERPGRQASQLRLACSDERHPYGVIPVPIAMVKGTSAGPTLLLAAGSHGDEYEGQILLRRLLRALDPDRVAGRIILLPALNLPAVRAGRRTSPLDGGNLNRAFPGDPDGGPTAMIAHYVASVLLPLCDFVLDLHSGGRSAEYLPCVHLRRGGTAALMARKLALAQAFAAPFCAVVGATSDDRSLSAACDRAGIAMVATELGGGGRLGSTALRVGRDGLARVLAHCGLLSEAGPEAETPTTFLETADWRCYVTAPRGGLFEPACRPGDRVAAGDPAGWIHPLDDPAEAPLEVNFQGDGMVVACRVQPLVEAGDHLCHTGAAVAPESLLD